MREGFKTSRGVTQWQIAATILRESVTTKDCHHIKTTRPTNMHPLDIYGALCVLFWLLTVWIL